MVNGKLQVVLVSAKGLDNSDFLSSMDPYVVVTYRSQEQKSSVATDQDSAPTWNETFVFAISGDDGPEGHQLDLKIYDKDNFSADDFVGEARIPLLPAIVEGTIPPTAYNVVKNDEFRGEIRLSFSFTPDNEEYHHQGREEFGGWRQSSNDY